MLIESYSDGTAPEAAPRVPAGAGAPPRFATVRTRAGFDLLRGEWDALHAVTPGNPFAAHAYIAAWAETAGAHRRLQVRLARQGGRLVGALALASGPVPRAWMIAAHDKAGLAGVLLAPDLPEATRQAVLAGLLRPRRGSFLLLEPLEEEQATLLSGAAGTAGLVVRRKRTFWADSADLSQGAEAWRAGLSRNSRRAYKRAVRDLQTEDFRCTDSREVGAIAAGEAYFAAAAASWKTRAGSGLAGSDENRAFLRALCRRSAPGALHITASFRGDTPVGATFACVKDGTLHLNAEDFNEDLAVHGPGRFLVCRLIEAAAEMGLERADTMRSSELNQSLCHDRRPLFRLLVARRGDPTWLLHRWQGLARRLRRRGRGGSPRARHLAEASR
jgi:CelD/BcsL family acetyltransferase involved in cellulose biosynthesis